MSILEHFILFAVTAVATLIPLLIETLSYGLVSLFNCTESGYSYDCNNSQVSQIINMLTVLQFFAILIIPFVRIAAIVLLIILIFRLIRRFLIQARRRT